MSERLSARRVGRLRRRVIAERCPLANNPGVMHRYEYAHYPLILDGYFCVKCGVAA